MYDKVRELGGVTFPVKFTDRLRLLNRRSRANAVKSTAIAKLIDLIPALGGPIFSTLADRRVDLARLVEDDAALAEHIRENVGGQFHVAGTCRMGAANDRQAVVDPAGRVRGFEGLRVVDASIMPTVPRGNTNIPTIMLAEKISAAIGAQERMAHEPPSMSSPRRRGPIFQRLVFVRRQSAPARSRPQISSAISA